MRTTLLTAFALGLGFVLGWLSRPAAKPVSPSTVPPAPTPTLARDPSPAIPTTPTVPAPVSEATAAERIDAFRHRVETLRWLRKSGIVFFHDALGRDSFSPSFCKVLELTPEETTRLNEAVLNTRQELDAARGARATSRTSEDGKTLVVDVPSVDVATSRAIYDRLVDTLKSTLGPERYEAFNELAGENFELSFDRFGLSNVRYELVLEPKFPTAGAPARFEYKRHFLDAAGVGKGWSGSTVTFAQIEKYDPVLARFLPAQVQTPEEKR